MTLKIRSTRVACNTSTGNQDITISGFGTPKAALLIASQATADATVVDHSMLSYGVAVSTTARWSIWGTTETGQATSDNRRGANASACVNIVTPTDGTADGVADFSSWITDGIQINWSNAPTSGFLLTTVLFGGTDLSAFAGSFSPSADINGFVDVTGVGFRPTDILTGFQGGPGSVRSIDFGIVHENGAGTVTNGFTGFAPRNGTTTHNVGSVASTSYGIGGVGEGGYYFRLNFSDFGNDGFRATTRVDNSLVATVYYLALRITTYDSYAGYITTPTSTGNQAQTGPGFKPQFVMQFMNGCEAADTHTNDDRAGVYGFSVADSTAQYSNMVAYDDNTTTTNSESQSDDQMAVLHADDGSAMIASSFVSLDTTGFTQNFSAVSATGKIWPIWVVEEEETSPSINVSDAATVGESVTVTVVGQSEHNVSVTDAVDLGESVSVVLSDMAVSISEGVTVADAPVVMVEGVLLVIDVSDSVTVGESVNAMVSGIIQHTYIDGPGGNVNTAEDNNLFGSAPTANLGAHANSGIAGNEHFILRFNLSGLTNNDDLISATMRLFIDDTPDINRNITATVYSISQANKDWIAGVSEGLAQAGESCYNALAADGAGGVTTAWAGSVGCSTSGTDYEASALGSVVVDTSAALGTESTFTLNAARIRGWRTSTNTNYGIIVRHSGASERHWETAESPTSAYRPRLEVVYYEYSPFLSVNVSDAVEVGESVNVLITTEEQINIDETDAVTLGESVTVEVSGPVLSVDDSVTVGEAHTVEAVLSGVDVTDGVTVGESIAAVLSDSSIDITDAVTVGESVLVQHADAEQINVSDSITALDDAVVQLQDTQISVIDAVVVADGAVLQISDMQIAASDGVTPGESIALLLPEIGSTTISVTDTVNVDESVSVVMGDALGIAVTDSAVVTDDASLGIGIALSVTDGVTPGESVDISASVGPLIEVSDSVTVADDVQVATDPLIITITDGIVLAEIVTVHTVEAGQMLISATDGVTIGEAVNVAALTLDIDVSDAVTLGESTVIGFGSITDPLFKGMWRGIRRQQL